MQKYINKTDDTIRITCFSRRPFWRFMRFFPRAFFPMRFSYAFFHLAHSSGTQYERVGGREKDLYLFIVRTSINEKNARGWLIDNASGPSRRRKIYISADAFLAAYYFYFGGASDTFSTIKCVLLICGLRRLCIVIRAKEGRHIFEQLSKCSVSVDWWCCYTAWLVIFRFKVRIDMRKWVRKD